MIQNKRCREILHKNNNDRSVDFGRSVRLRAFFEAHEEDLKDDYWEGITIDEAIEKTRKEAKKLEEFFRICRKGTNNLSCYQAITWKIEKLEKDKVKVVVKKHGKSA